MRKRIIESARSTGRPQLGEEQLGEEWMNLDRIAEVEVTSENHDYPIECALDLGRAQGWRAGTRGARVQHRPPEPAVEKRDLVQRIFHQSAQGNFACTKRR